MSTGTNYTRFLNRLGTNEESDEVFTPEEVTDTLLPFLSPEKTYYEATSGSSLNIVKGLTSRGIDIRPSKGKDFFECSEEDVFDGIITNPPYSKKDEFIRHCYSLKKPFALLLPVSAFQGQARGFMFLRNGISALVLNRRVDFTGKKAPTFGVAWFMGNGFCEPNRLWFVHN